MTATGYDVPAITAVLPCQFQANTPVCPRDQNSLFHSDACKDGKNALLPTLTAQGKITRVSKAFPP
jgi:hypothetical protein